MEVDGIESLNISDGGKFANLKSFVTAAREFETTHSESSVNLMNRYLGLIASACDLSVFSPGRSEVCAFFGSLWRVMCDGRAPHWAGLAVLARACIEPNARHALTHTYKFLPILTSLLSDSISNEKKIKLLTVMQDISYGIKISWQESYLSGLMKQLTTWITQPLTDQQQQVIGHKSLTVLVNVCYGNLPAIYALMRTVDTKDFVVHLINLKDGGYGGVEVCRLLLCLSGATRGSGSTRQADVHGYLACTMKTFRKAVRERDATQLLHAYTFLKDLCADQSLRPHVAAYQNFAPPLTEALQDANRMCECTPEEAGEPGSYGDCLRNIFQALTVLTNLDLYSLRSLHESLVSLCLRGSQVCLAEALELFAAIVTQYKDEGRLPHSLITMLSDGLPGLLVPPALEPGKAGLQWLQVVCALCETIETQERVLLEVAPDGFEDTLISVLQYNTQNGPVGMEASQQASILACKIALSLAPLKNEWEATLGRLLNHHQVRKLLCGALTGSNNERRKQVLQLIKHHCFPPDLIPHVFSEPCPSEVATVSPLESPRDGASITTYRALSASQEAAADALIAQLSHALNNGQIRDIATSSVMELYGYKMTCLEQRLHSHTIALQGASEQIASLQHTLAMLQATNSSQQDVLYTTQMQNEKHKQTIDELHKQLEDAEATLRQYKVKIAAERLDKENLKEHLQKELRAQLATMDKEIKTREKDFEERMRHAETEYKSLQKKLEFQTNKNSELAGVLIKFEERVKQRDKRLEEAAATELAYKKELDHKEQSIKQLEKTVSERENRLYQLTTQLEEMKRIQEMVAKLMSKSTNAEGKAKTAS